MKFALSARRSNTDSLLFALEHSLATAEFGIDGTLLDANENFLSLTGYALAEIRGQHHRILVEESHGLSEDYRAFWAALNRGERQTCEHRQVAKGGRITWIRATYTPILDRRGNPVRIVALAMDVTAEKRQSAHAAEQAAALNRSQAVVRFGLDGTVLDANQAFLEAMGYRLEEVKGQQHWMFAAPAEAQSHTYEDFWKSLRRGEDRSADYMLLGRGAREVWFRATYAPVSDESGRPCEIVMFGTLITQEKKIAIDYGGQVAAIDRLQAVVQFDLSGHIEDVNDNFLKAVGYRAEEVKGQHHFMFVDEAYAVSPEYKEFWEKLKRGEHFSAVYQRIGKGGRSVWLHASYNPILDASGQPYKVVKYATDVTTSMEARARAIDAAEQTLSNVWTASAAAEEMNTSIAEITARMGRSKAAVDDIHNQALTADKSTGQLRQSTQSMDDVIQLIAKISQQINLLALNATIEAARAGEAGRGFAVVATEVKNLANQAHSATTRISEQIAAMQTASDDVIGTLASISQGIGTVQTFVSEAAGAIQDQSLATQDIAANMQNAADKVANINRSLDEWVVGLEERRRDPRLRTFQQAKIILQGRADPIDCILRDISAAGARVELKGDEPLPDRFKLRISGTRGEKDCALVRRAGGMVSMRFVQD
jgi:methyl-accepting chemotaxis protein